MSGKKADDHHYDNSAGHNENTGKRLLYLGKYYPEYDVQKHNLDSEPHLIVYEENAEETANNSAESEVCSNPDIAQKCRCQIDIIADKERYQYSKYSSSHKAFDVVLICHPSLYESESGTEEEESYREYSVIVEVHELAYINTCEPENNNSLVKHYKHCQEALELFC